jgi:two-component system, sensor histidine kinase and response regulator
VDTLRILVVDDEPGMRMGAVRALRDLSASIPEVHRDVHFEIDEADSGERALEMMAAACPDILLLDHKLPGMSGLDVLQAVAERKLDTLTVMITAYASLDVAISATKRGAYDFLPKPFTPDELSGTVRKAARYVVLQRQARKLAEEKRRVRFQFIRVLAHELKAPLAAMEGYLRIVKDQALGADPAAYDGMLDRCLVRSEQMRKLILDLLDLTHIESGEKKRELARVDVVEAAKAALDAAAPAAAERGITLELHVGEKGDSPLNGDKGTVPFFADRGEIDMLFGNLVSNAVKYNRDGGRVDVTVTRHAGSVRIAVADTGIGLKPEDASRLFEEFARIKNEKTRHILGSGLGLSIVRKLAMLYDGDATVTSEENAGSTFTVVLNDPS